MSRPALVLFLAATLLPACAHHEPPSVDASPAAEATAALAPATPFPATGAPAAASAQSASSALAASSAAGGATAASAAPAAADSGAAVADQDPSDPTLPQTHDRPLGGDPALIARIDALWAAIVADDPTLATSAFFPLAAYQQVKAINNPASDWNHRLLAAFAEDIHALHKRLGPHRASAKLTNYELPDARARWVEPNEEYNKIGYFRVFGTTVHYHFDRGEDDPGHDAPSDTTAVRHDYSFSIASMISWRGQWYIVHLNSVR